MARQSTFAKGGGFLNEVDATITGYRFTDDFVDPNGVVYPYDPDKNVKDLKTGKLVPIGHAINMVLSFRVDGAEDEVYQALRISTEFDKWSISEDGHTLTPEVDGARIGGSSGAAKFILSWEAASKEGASSDDESVVDYTPIIGSRVRLVQRDYSAAELESMKKLGASEKRKGKDGKEYTRQSLCVDQVYELAAPEAKPNGKSKTPPKNEAKPLGTKGKTTKPAEPDVDLEQLAGAAIVEIINRVGKNGQIEKTKFSIQALLTPLLKGQPYREDVRKLMLSDNYLTRIQASGLEVDGNAYAVAFDKVKQTVAIVHEA